MFDIGFAELLLLAIVALLVIGPERLPETARTLGLWVGRLRRMFSSAKSELERELGVDDVRRQLHNERIMEELREIEKKHPEESQTDEENTIAPPPATQQDSPEHPPKKPE